MKFAHMSDIRLGLVSESGRRWGKERVVEVFDAFGRVLSRLAETKTDLVLITGGLFAHCPLTTELNEANRLMAACPGITFVIIAGQSDSLRRSSPVMSYRWAPNVHYVLSGKPEKLSLPGIHTEIYAASCAEESTGSDELIAFFEADRDRRESVSVAMLVEPDEEKASRFSCAGFSYAALGGNRSKMEAGGSNVYYAGGLEAENMADTGNHGYLKGEISDVTGILTGLEFVPFSSVSYIPLRITVDPSISPAELEKKTEEEILKRGPANIYRIHIIGSKKPGVVFDMAGLKERRRIAEIQDETEPQYDFDSLYTAHTQDIIGYYISRLGRNREEMSEIDKRAMFFGIDALIKSAEKPISEADN